MFRKSYVHHQEDYIVHAAAYGMFSVHLCKQSTCLNADNHSTNTVYQVHTQQFFVN